MTWHPGGPPANCSYSRADADSYLLDHGDLVLRTAFTRRLAGGHPIASAPMGGSSGGALAAAVSNGGGLGLVGGGRGDPAHDLVAAIVADAERALTLARQPR